MPLSGMKIERFSALMNGVFMGVGFIFLIWGATDIIFPISNTVNVLVFGLARILLGLISLGVGAGVEAVQWAKIGKPNSAIQVNQSGAETPELKSDQRSFSDPQ